MIADAVNEKLKLVYAEIDRAMEAAGLDVS